MRKAEMMEREFWQEEKAEAKAEEIGEGWTLTYLPNGEEWWQNARVKQEMEQVFADFGKLSRYGNR